MPWSTGVVRGTVCIDGFSGSYQYVAGTSGMWQVTHGRIVVGHPSTAPANTTTPVVWLEACSQNGNTLGRVPLYQ